MIKLCQNPHLSWQSHNPTSNASKLKRNSPSYTIFELSVMVLTSNFKPFQHSFCKVTNRPPFDQNFKQSHLTPNHQFSTPNLIHIYHLTCPYHHTASETSAWPKTSSSCFWIFITFASMWILEFGLSLIIRMMQLALGVPFEHVWLITLVEKLKNHLNWKSLFTQIFEFSKPSYQWSLLYLLVQIVWVCHF